MSQQPKEPRKPQNLGVIVNIPVIIREKEILDRKQTIDVFKAKRVSEQENTIKKNDKNEKVGKFFINELWSEKFHKQVLKESKIKEVCERIEKLHRRFVQFNFKNFFERNLSNLLEDVDQANNAKSQSTKEKLPKIDDSDNIPQKNKEKEQDISHNTQNNDFFSDSNFQESLAKQYLKHIVTYKPQNLQAINTSQVGFQFILIIFIINMIPKDQKLTYKDSFIFQKPFQSPQNSQSQKSLNKLKINNSKLLSPQNSRYNNLLSTKSSTKINYFNRTRGTEEFQEKQFFETQKMKNKKQNQNVRQDIHFLIDQCKIFNGEQSAFGWKKKKTLKPMADYHRQKQSQIDSSQIISGKQQLFDNSSILQINTQIPTETDKQFVNVDQQNYKQEDSENISMIKSKDFLPNNNNIRSKMTTQDQTYYSDKKDKKNAFELHLNFYPRFTARQKFFE